MKAAGLRGVRAAVRGRAAGAGLPRAAGRPADAGLGLPVPRRARRAGLPARERPRRRAARALLVPRPRPRRAARGAGRPGRRARRLGHARGEGRPSRRAAGAALARTPRRSPACRASPAAPSATSPGTRPGSSSGFPTTTARPGASVASFAFYGSLVAFDHVRQRLVLIAQAEPGQPRGLRPRAAGPRRLRGGPRLGATRPPATRRSEPPAALPLTDGGAFRAAVLARQGVHRRRRHLPGRALAPAHRRLRHRPLHRLPRAAHGEPVALHVLPEGRRRPRSPAPRPEMLVRVEGQKVETRPIAGTRPRHDGGNDDAVAARAAGRREGAGRAPDARGPRPQRPRPRLPLRQRAGAGAHEGRALQPRGPHRELGGGGARGRARTPSTRSPRPSRRARSPARPKIRAMQIIDELEPRGPRPLRRGPRLHRPARQPRLLHRHPHAPPARPGRPRSRPAPASWPTPTPPPRSARPRPRRRRSSRRSRVAGGLA